jgi:lipopolysaccharide/colanic/teichoic acid biosynthesis glycosyltransferase
VFVEQFKETIPLYMVKHYVKPGMTGLAQIKGLRGDTSVEDRIHEDIEYIENWTFWRDIYILLKTPMKAVNKNEKYVEVPVEGDLLDDETTRDFAA